MPDLSGPRARAAAKMGSTCTIWRKPSERQDDVVNPVTLRLEPAPGATVLYSGACWVFGAPGSDDWGGGQTDEDDERPSHVMHVPYNAPVPRSGDRVVIDSCPDSAVVHDLVDGGYLLRVKDVNRSEYLVTRIFTVVRIGGPPPAA